MIGILSFLDAANYEDLIRVNMHNYMKNGDLFIVPFCWYYPELCMLTRCK
jgi:uncharacterized radical SAM superfamily Fe-S cluster-containing enzyme